MGKFGEVEGSRGNRGILHYRFLQSSSFSDSHVLVNQGFKNEVGTKELLNPFANFFVEVLGLRFILHLLSTRNNNPRGTLPLVQSEALVLDRGIWSGVFVEALVGVVVGNTLQ